MFPVGGWPIGDVELSFARSLLEDLAPLGFEIHSENGRVQFTHAAPESLRSYREFYAEAHRQLHKKLVATKWSEVIEFERNLAEVDPAIPCTLRRWCSGSGRSCGNSRTVPESIWYSARTVCR